jgi:opacity protein-like surface antigen
MPVYPAGPDVMRKYGVSCVTGWHGLISPKGCCAAAALTISASLLAQVPAALAGGMLPELPAPVLKPTIVAWHGAYAGVMVAGQSVRIERAHANTGVRQQQLKGLAGIVAGYNWRSKQGRNSEIYGVEADAMSLTRLNGHSDHEPDWLATVRARYGVTSGPTMVYATAGFSLTSHKLDLNGASRLYPGAVAGAGIETLAIGKLRTRLEYLYSHPLTKSAGRDDAHTVRAAILVRLPVFGAASR